MRQFIFIFIGICTLFFLWASTATAQTSSLVTQSIFFATDSHQLSAEAVQTLEAFAPQLDTYADYSIEIKAHTDNRGTDGYNKTLSDRRAEAVYQYLVQKGVKSTKTSSKGLGESQPLYDNTDTEGQQKNRRVDVLITTYLFDSLEELLKRATKDNLQTFYIQPNKDQTITARNGTTIGIAAGSLVLPNGTSPTSTITLQVREALSVADILLENLSTVSNGQILETGGMAYLAAQANGKDLQVKNGSSLQIALPTAKVEAGMELFYGNRGANKTINWQPANVSFTQKAKPTNEVPPPPINLDFLKIEVYVPDMTTPPTFATAMLPKPIKAVKPYEPISPQPPKRSNFKYRPKFPKSLFMKKKDVQAIEEDRYQRKMKVYQKSYEAYEQRLVKYNQSLKNYYQQDSIYAPKQQQWSTELQNRVDLLNQFTDEYASYEAAIRLKQALPKWYTLLPDVAKNIQDNPNLIDNLHQNLIKILLKEANAVKPNNPDFLQLNQLALGQEVMADKGLLKSYKLHDGTYYRTRVNNEIIELFDKYHYAKLNELRDQINEQLIAMGKFTNGSLDRYMSEINTLGWINCDRFYDYPAADKVAITVAETNATVLYAICKDMKSILPLYQKGGVYVSDNLPKGLAIKLVAVRLDKGKPQLAIMDTQVDNNEVYKMNYQSCSINELKQRMKELN